MSRPIPRFRILRALKIISHVFMVLPLLYGLAGHTPAHALSVDQIRFGVHPEKVRLVLDLSEASDFRVFTLDNPARLVIDLPSFTWQAGSVAPQTGAHIASVRQGHLKEGVSRIVFDLQNPVKVQSAFVLTRRESKPDRLVIDYLQASPAEFSAQRGQILGTLETETTRTASAAASRTAGSLPVPAPTSKPRTVKPLVIIDPGHGGVDPGAVGTNNVFEKDVVLALSKELKKQLVQSGQYRVMMTRESDVFLKLRDRVNFARRHEADLFISVHADSLRRRNVSGASVYTLSETASDKQTAALAARENRADLIAGIDLSTEDDEVAGILVDLAMRDTMNQSKFFANILVDSFSTKGVSLLDNPHRYAGFAVLKAPDIPSVLVEAGFMSNRQEAHLLTTPSHRRKIATALKRGIDAYFEQVKKNQRI